MAEAPLSTPPDAEEPSDFEFLVSRWREELDVYSREYDDWARTAEKIEKRFELEGYNRDVSRLNLLWSNVKTLIPALYSRTPEPVAQRRWKDKNPLARIGSSVIERFLMAEMEQDHLDDVFLSCVQDVLLVGRGVPWVSYEANIAEVDGVPRVVDERARVEYVYWKDFAHSPLKNWDDVKRHGWVARREYLTRRQGIDRFGEMFRKVPLTAKTATIRPDDNEKIASLFRVAEVWEIWDAEDRVVLWICKDYPERPLDVQRDPWGLKGFFPCPKPLYATTGTAGLIPQPDYEQYRSLAVELDSLTARISLLTSALRVAGVYDSSLPNLGQMLLDDGEVNKLVPVPDLQTWKTTNAGSTLADVVKFMPIDMIASVLSQLYLAREQVKALCYEVTGISDIVRGQVDPREKAAQSQIKNEWAASRIDPRKHDVVRLCREVIAMKAELMAEHFQPDALREMSGFDYMPEVQKIAEGMGPQVVEQVWEQVMSMLRTEHMRAYQVQVETDSTVLANDQASKEAAVEYLQATGPYLDRFAATAQAMPQMAPVLGEQLLFVARKFRAGRGLEGHLEDLVDTLEEQAQQPQPSPEEQAAQAEMEAKQQEHQLDIEAKQVDLQVKQQAAALDMQAKEQESRIDAAVEAEKVEAKRAELAIERAELDIKRGEVEIQRDELDVKREELEVKREAVKVKREEAKAKRAAAIKTREATK